MKVLGICCSPRKNSNTEFMLQTVLDNARAEGADTEFVTLAGKNLLPCDACQSCAKTGKCHINDYMQEIYPKLLEADAIALASPVYFWSVSGQAKMLIDRTFALMEGSKLAGKFGAAIAVADRSGGAAAIEVLQNFFATTGMLSVGWAIGLSTIESYKDKQAIKKDERGLKRATTLGKNIVKYLRAYQAPKVGFSVHGK